MFSSVSSFPNLECGRVTRRHLSHFVFRAVADCDVDLGGMDNKGLEPDCGKGGIDEDLEDTVGEGVDRCTREAFLF